MVWLSEFAETRGVEAGVGSAECLWEELSYTPISLGREFAIDGWRTCWFTSTSFFSQPLILQAINANMISSLVPGIESRVAKACEVSRERMQPTSHAVLRVALTCGGNLTIQGMCFCLSQS
jgi:hypothetical protein